MLIKNATLIDHRGKKNSDIRISDGLITQIGNLAPNADEQVIDLENRWLLSGAVDLSFHLKDPGQKRTESISESTTNALRGGITTLLAQPDTTPAIDNETVVEYILAKAEKTDGARVLISGEVAKKDRLNDIAKLFKAGVEAIKTKSSIDTNFLRRAFEYALMADKLAIVQCQNSDLEGVGVMHDGFAAAKLGLPSIPTFAESCEVAKIAEIRHHIGNKLLVEAVTLARSIELLDSYKNENLFVSVMLSNLLLIDEDANGFNTQAKLTPPLREASDRDALIRAVKAGKIDIISSGHMPQDRSSKDMPFETASYGASIAEYFLPLCFTYLISENKLTVEEFLRAASFTPAKLLGLNSGFVEVGARADLVAFDPDGFTEVLPKESVADNIWTGKKLKGKVICGFVGGNLQQF